MVKPRIGSALKVVDAQIAASRESSTESWVGRDGSSGFERLRWRRSKPENPVVENHPDGRGGLATYPSLLVRWIGMFYQVLQKSNIQLGISFKFFVIFSHDFVKISNFNEFCQLLWGKYLFSINFVSYLVFTCKSLRCCGVCQIEANLHLTTRTKGNSLFYDYGRQELVFGATSIEKSSQSAYVGFHNWQQKHFYWGSFLLLVTRLPQDNWRSPIDCNLVTKNPWPGPNYRVFF